MNNEQTAYKEDTRHQKLRLLTPKEILKIEPKPIEVPENTELVISPDDPKYESSFARVSISSFDDLRILGLVPRKLPEDKIRQAILEDDSEVYNMSTKAIHQQPAHNCTCSNEHSGRQSHSIRSAYNSIRNKHNPSLARVLSDYYEGKVEWDSPITAITRKWVLSATDFARPGIVTALFQDITINKNSKLVVTASTKSLLAWNIWIHSTGKLIAQGGYLKIWANSINHFRGILDESIVKELHKIQPVWKTGE